ncbi:uncharacterized protein, partial [Triticum aestivum]|uniref:uncharacterized protein n=1 Tax=Triticum aestivum TaxID=4565 RepID=UPI001D0254EE
MSRCAVSEHPNNINKGDRHRLPHPVGIVLFNNSETDFTVKPGDCVTQMIVQVIVMPEVDEVEDLYATVRRLPRWRTSMPPSGGCRGKLLSKWEGPYVIEEVYHSGAIKINNFEGTNPKVVNGQRIKHYIS